MILSSLMNSFYRHYILRLSYLFVCILTLISTLITPNVSYADTIKDVKVINFSPYDKQGNADGDIDELTLSANIVITFDKEIIYDMSQYRRGLPFNIEISGYNGTCVWNVVNERTINCPIYDPVLRPATNYTVQIHKDILPWATLNKNYTFTFETNRLSVEPSGVTVNTSVDKLSPVFSLYFNTPVDVNNVSSNIEFLSNAVGGVKGLAPPSAVGARVISSDGSLFYVSPIGKLVKNRVYDLVLHDGVVPSDGVLPSVRHSFYRYSTYDEPTLLYAFCSVDEYYPRGIKRALTGRSGKAVTDSAVKLDDCLPDERLVLIFSDPVSGVDNINGIKFKAINDIKTAFISEKLKADTRYLLTLNSTDIKSSVNPKNLLNTYSITFATKSYPPMLYKWYQYAVLPKYIVDYGRNLSVKSAVNLSVNDSGSQLLYGNVPISLRNVDNLSIVYHTLNMSDVKDSKSAVYVAGALTLLTGSHRSLTDDAMTFTNLALTSNLLLVRNHDAGARIANYSYYNEKNKLYNSTVEVSKFLYNQSGVVEGLFNVNGEASSHANNTNIYTTRGLATSGKFLYQITPFQVFVKIGALRSVVWVLDTKTLKPVKGARISLFADRDNIPPADHDHVNSETDSSGIAYLPGRYALDDYYGVFPDSNYNDDFVNNEARDKYIYHVRVSKNGDVALLPISSSFFVNGGALAEDNLDDSGLGFFGVAKNVVYKPGAVVNFNVFVRERALAYDTNFVFEHKNFVLPPENDTFVITVVDSTFKTVAVMDNVTYDMAVDDGVISGMFNLPNNSTDGFYTAFISFKNDVRLKDNQTLYDINPLTTKSVKIFSFAVVNPDKLQTVLSHKFDKTVLSPDDGKLNITTTLKFVNFTNNSTVKKVNPENLVYTTAFATPLEYLPKYHKTMLKGFVFPPFGEQYDVFYDTTKTLKETYSKEYAVPKKLAYGVLEVTSELRNDNAKPPLDKETETVIDSLSQNKYIESSLDIFGTKTLLGINEGSRLHYANRPIGNISVLAINPFDEDNVVDAVPLDVSLFYYDNNAGSKNNAYVLQSTCKNILTKSIPVLLSDVCLNNSALIPIKVGVYKLVFNYTDKDGKAWGNEYKIYVTANSVTTTTAFANSSNVSGSGSSNGSSRNSNNSSNNNSNGSSVIVNDVSSITRIDNAKQATFGFLFDKKEYEPGDNATILVSVPIKTGLLFGNKSYDNAKNVTIPILITVENRDLLSLKTANISIDVDNLSKIMMDNESLYVVTKEIQIPVTRSMFPTAYVSVSMLGKDNALSGRNSIMVSPEFVTRYKKISVTKSQNDIDLDVNIDKYVEPENGTNKSELGLRTANGEPLTEYTLNLSAKTFNNKTDRIVVTAIAVLNTTTTSINPSEGVFNPNIVFKNTLRQLNSYSLLEQMLTDKTAKLTARGLHKVDEYDGYKDVASMEAEFNTINSIDSQINDYVYQPPNLVPPQPDGVLSPLFISVSTDLLDTINNIQSKDSYKSSTLELFNVKRIGSDGNYRTTFTLPTIDYEVNWDIFIIAVDDNGNVGYVKKTINSHEIAYNENKN